MPNTAAPRPAQGAGVTGITHAPRPDPHPAWRGKGVRVGTRLWLWHAWEPLNLYPFRVRVQELVRFRDGYLRAWCAVDHPTTYGSRERYLVSLEGGHADSERAYRADPYGLHVAWVAWQAREREFEARVADRERFTLGQQCLLAGVEGAWPPP